MTSNGPSADQIDGDRRFRPTADQLMLCEALLRAGLRIDHVTVGLVMPGKLPGVWEAGQDVEPVAGLWPVLDIDLDPRNPMSKLAAAAARRHLGNRPGTVGYALVYLQQGRIVFTAYEDNDPDHPARRFALREKVRAAGWGDLVFQVEGYEEVRDNDDVRREKVKIRSAGLSGYVDQEDLTPVD